MKKLRFTGILCDMSSAVATAIATVAKHKF